MVIDNRAVFDLLCHPSLIGVEDPGLETIDLVLDIVKSAGDRAAIVDPEVIARRVRREALKQWRGVISCCAIL